MVVQTFKTVNTEKKFQCSKCQISTIQDSKSVRYTHNFVVSNFVITVNFSKDLLRTLLGTQKKRFRYICVNDSTVSPLFMFFQAISHPLFIFSVGVLCVGGSCCLCPSGNCGHQPCSGGRCHFLWRLPILHSLNRTYRSMQTPSSAAFFCILGNFFETDFLHCYFFLFNSGAFS